MQNHNQLRKETLCKMLDGETIFPAYYYKTDLMPKPYYLLLMYDLVIQKYILTPF